MAADPNVISHGPFAIFTKSQATAAKRTWLFYLSNAADGTAATGKTIAGADFLISKAGGAFGNATGTVTELTGGWYKMVFAAADLDTEGPLGIHITEAGCTPVIGGVFVSVLDLFTATVNPGAGGIVAASFGAGAIDAAAVAPDAIGASELAAAGASEIVSALVTANAVGGATRAITKTFGPLPLLNANESNYLGMENALEMVVSLAGTWDGATVTLYTSENPEAGVGALWTAVASGAKTADATVTVTGPHKAVKATMSSAGAGSEVVVTGALRFAE